MKEIKYDIWIYNSKFNKKYNKLYDLYYQAGLKVEQMRVASPFINCGIHTLKLYKVIDPYNWAKLVGRVNGATFAAIYGGTSAMGWKNIEKPSHFTWKEYCYFLLNTLNEDLRQHYIKKLNSFIEFWKEQGEFENDSNTCYKDMCTCILKNDYFFKNMEFAQTKKKKEKRKSAIDKYRNL